MVQYGANIEKICIDNSDIRQRIIGDNRLKITVVPTLLSIYPTGVIEKYEGEKVIELLNASFGPSVEPAIKQRPAEPNPEKKETVKTIYFVHQLSILSILPELNIGEPKPVSLYTDFQPITCRDVLRSSRPE